MVEEQITLKSSEVKIIGGIIDCLDSIQNMEELDTFIESIDQLQQLRNIETIEELQELVVKGYELLSKMSLPLQDTFDKSPSGSGELLCPKCNTRNTKPTPGCVCRSLGGNHIMMYHHVCK